MICHHLVYFGVHKSSGSGNRSYLIFHVTSQDNLTQGSCKFMAENSLWYVTTMTDLVTIGIVILEISFFISHITSCDHRFHGLCKFIGGIPPW